MPFPPGKTLEAAGWRKTGRTQMETGKTEEPFGRADGADEQLESRNNSPPGSYSPTERPQQDAEAVAVGQAAQKAQRQGGVTHPDGWVPGAE